MIDLFGSKKKAQKRAGKQALSQIREQGKQQRENLQFGEDLARERGAFGMLGNQTNRALEDQMGSMFGTLTNNLDNDSIFNQAQGISNQAGMNQQNAYNQTVGNLFGGGYEAERNRNMAEMARARTQQHNNVLQGIQNSLSGNVANAAYNNMQADMGGGSNFRNANQGAVLNAITQSAGNQAQMEQQNIQDRMNEQSNLMRQKLAAMPMIGQYEDDMLTRLSGGKSVKAMTAPYIELMNSYNPFRYG